MTKRLIDIDDELLALARELADAGTIKGTVEEALRRLIRIEMGRRHIADLEDALEPRAVEMLEENRNPRSSAGGLSH